GYGNSVNGDPDPKVAQALKNLPPPGRDATQEVKAAIVAVQRLAAAEGHHLKAPQGGGGSTSRDRITIAAAATAGIALVAAFVLYRRQKRSPQASAPTGSHTLCRWLRVPIAARRTRRSRSSARNAAPRWRSRADWPKS